MLSNLSPAFIQDMSLLLLVTCGCFAFVLDENFLLLMVTAVAYAIALFFKSIIYLFLKIPLQPSMHLCIYLFPFLLSPMLQQ